jgi:cell division protein FtsB
MLQWLKRRTKPLVFPLIFLSITAYFGWNATQGDRGLVAFAQRKLLLQKVQADQAAAKMERDALETRVAGLRSENLDTDTLDERSRAMLNLAEPNEVIIKYADKDKLF